MKGGQAARRGTVRTDGTLGRGWRQHYRGSRQVLADGRDATLLMGERVAATAVSRVRPQPRHVAPAVAAGTVIVVGYRLSERLLPALLDLQPEGTHQRRCLPSAGRWAWAGGGKSHASRWPSTTDVDGVRHFGQLTAGTRPAIFASRGLPR